MTTRNKFKVSKRQWAKWTEGARATFNDIYGGCSDQSLFNSSPKTTHLKKAAWDCIRWNIAFWSADLVSHREKAARKVLRKRGTVLRVIEKAA